MATVEETGRRKNTFFFFSSDNGGPAPGRVTSNGPFRAGKGTVYEGGVRTVAFATWDGHIKPGSTVSGPMHMVDLNPTLRKLAGASLDNQKLPLDGMDIMPCLTDGKPSPHKEILFNTTPNNGALRVGDWKIVVNGNRTQTEGEEQPAEPKAKKKKKQAAQSSDAVELFNLADDPYEKKNLASSQPEKLKELRARYDALAKQAVKPKNAKD